MARFLRVRRFVQRPGLVTWWAIVTGGAALMTMTGRGPLGVVTWRDPAAFFWAITIGRHWRGWVASVVALVIAAAALLLAQPRRFAAAAMAAPTIIGVTVASMLLFLALSLRQLRLYWIGRDRMSLWASLGLVFIALGGLVWVDTHTYSTGWWFAHAVDTVGVLLAVGFLLVGPRPGRSVSEILAPVLARDPLSAFALGLSPVVHRFVDTLSRKDQITRDHVVRVGELALRSGTRAGIPARRLRDLGLAALLHDIGKLATPDEILNANRSLSSAEFDVVEQHPVVGEALLQGAPELAGAATFVRWHHERFDGTGYPDGINGERIPVEVGIISVVDAFDAMTNNRQYRQGIDVDSAVAILVEHAGRQWDPRCVEIVIEEIRRHGTDDHPLWGAGSRVTDGSQDLAMLAEVCLEALPDLVRSTLLGTPAQSEHARTTEQATRTLAPTQRAV